MSELSDQYAADATEDASANYTSQMSAGIRMLANVPDPNAVNMTYHRIPAYAAGGTSRVGATRAGPLAGGGMMIGNTFYPYWKLGLGAAALAAVLYWGFGKRA